MTMHPDAHSDKSVGYPICGTFQLKGIIPRQEDIIIIDKY
jgi:hypothetical protein